MTKSQLNKAFLFAENLHNVGDLVLVLQLAYGLKTYCGIDDLTVRQWHPPSAEIVELLRARGIAVQSGKSPSSLFHRRALLLYGGGQVVRDNSSVASLCAVAATMLLSRLGGNMRVALAIGIGPLKSRRRICLWRIIMAELSLLTTRDMASFQRSTALANDKAAITLTADLAFLPSPLHPHDVKSPGQAHVVIAPCDDTGEGRNLIPSAVAIMAERIARKTGVGSYYLLAHDPRPGMDTAVCAKIAGHLTRDGNAKVVNLASADIHRYLDAYASASAVVTNRLHSVIFSLLAGKPVFIIDDGNDKLRNVARQFDLPVLPQSEPSNNDLASTDAPDLGMKRQLAVERATKASIQNFVLLNQALKGSQSYTNAVFK